jgi:hypothetical protein
MLRPFSETYERAAMRNATSAGAPALLILFSIAPPALPQDSVCDAQSREGAVCLCAISALHPTQSSVGMKEVEIKAEKLEAKAEEGSKADFLSYLRKDKRQEPVVIGPSGIFYITDHHHLARALYQIGVTETYCKIVDDLSGMKPDAFWKQLEDKNEVYLKDENGNPITPQDLPGSVKDLSNNPFRSLAGAVRELCGFKKRDASSSGEDFLEFHWADYFRAHWAETGIAKEDIDERFNDAASAALRLAASRDAHDLPGYTGKMSCGAAGDG